MKSAIRSVAFLIAAAATAGVVWGADATADKVKAALRAKYPESQVQSVAPAARMPGWYEVATPDELVYTNADASLLFIGRVVDVANKTDLTAQRWNAMQSIDFAKLPLDKAVKVVRGNGSRIVAVFSDPLCPYCQQLEPELAKLDNVTVYTFLFPLESIHPGATAKASAIWCAPDKSAAWTAWMFARQEAPQANCNLDGLNALLDLGRDLKVNATPTLFFADGHRVGGYIPQDALERELAAAAPAKP